MFHRRFWSYLLGLMGLLGWASIAQAQGTSANCAKPNVLLVLNKSSNMSSNGKWNQARLALGQLVPPRDQNTRFGMVLFDTTARVAVNFQDNALTQLGLALVTANPSGQANHKAAMTAVRTYLTTEIQRDAVPSRTYIVVLVTDGTSNDGNPQPEIAALRRLTAGGVTKDVRTYVMAISPSGPTIVQLLQWAVAGGTSRPYSNAEASQLSTELAQFEPQPRPEACNNQDDDCDGQIDEDLQRNCIGNCANGTTATGAQKCAAGQWGPCVVQIQPEQCNGRDDDCNGQIDDNIKPQTCQTACGTGQMTCQNGQWVNCSAPQPSPEVCDGKDNNCNGTIDEGCTCKDGDTQPCGSKVGECKPGVQTCVNGTWSRACVGGQNPQTEVCDGKDNDCDGLIDENLTRTCNNACGAGTETCSNGQWVKCTAPQPTPEVCDGKDNNCDGNIDEGCPCQIGQVRTCGSNVGACQQGFNVCLSGQWSTQCFNSQGPSPEVCDNIDNDCNGTIDENLTRTCNRPCGSGTERCVAGRWIGCNAPNPQPEVCDGVDNDCDGQIDNNLSRTCYSGPDGTANVGECKAGTQICQLGKWGPCQGEVTPQKETCNGKDDDCNGQIDDGCPCQPGQTQTCGLNIGICKPGTQACVNGQWGPCQGQVGPQKEDCNRLDDDCDGQIDENLTRPCGNACGPGTESCIFGVWRNCTAPPSRPEICGNNIDDDCNGLIDETCPCRNGQTRPCGSNVGECKFGLQECVNGIWSTACLGGVTGTPEVCDGKDNDCDGTIDNGVCTCKPGEKRLCGSKVGECKEGSQVCDATGQWGPCQGQIGPTREVCDGKDNDCDGQIDNGVCACVAGATRSCYNGPPNTINVGICKTGSQICDPNRQWGPCVGEVLPQKEACDGLDNDCNGQVDDGGVCSCKDGEVRTCYTGPPNTRNVGACRDGAQRCVGGQWSPCLNEVLPKGETCDSIDNNCNGQIDENLSRPCRTACGTGLVGCVGGKIVECTAPKPTMEACNGRDDDCNGLIDDAAQCPAGTLCLQGKCIPVIPDGGNPDVRPDVGPDILPQCSSNSNCPPGFSCIGGRCIRDVVPDTRPDTRPDVVGPDVVGPDTTNPPSACKVNDDCGVGRVCRWGRCHTSCTGASQCSAGASICWLGLCVPECVVDKHCALGQVCRAGWCVGGCRDDSHCTSNQKCVGFACVEACQGDNDCSARGGYCNNGSCIPFCNLAGDCPAGFACTNGRCVSACSSFEQTRLCAESQVCSAGQCQGDCSKAQCTDTGTSCQGNVCRKQCNGDTDCQSIEACIAGFCAPRCHIQDDCPQGLRCHEGICWTSCKTEQDCPSGRGCLENRCVDVCSEGTSGGVDGGNGDGGIADTTPDQGAKSCPNAALLCSGGTCQVTCQQAGSCKTGYGCAEACFGCAKTVCLPPCRADVDCPSKYFCHRGLCSLGCKNDQQCEQGETCESGRCIRKCEKNGDCPVPMFCESKRCVDPDPLKKDRGNIGSSDLPKLKLAGGCGCETAPGQASSWIFLLALGLFLLPLVVRRTRRSA